MTDRLYPSFLFNTKFLVGSDFEDTRKVLSGFKRINNIILEEGEDKSKKNISNNKIK